MAEMKLILTLLLFTVIALAVSTDLSIEINSGAEYTNSSVVSLLLTANGATNCSLSNDDATYTEPFPFTSPTTMNWNLTGSDGLKTVYFKCLGEDGNWSDSVSDSITLDTTTPTASSKTPSGTITNRKPAISVSISDGSGTGIEESSIVLKLDNNAVTSNYSSGIISYTPSNNLDFGSHTVHLTVADKAGNTLSTSWNFTISSEGVGFGSFSPANNSYTSDKTPDISIILIDSGSGINTTTLRMNVDGKNVTDAHYSSSSKNYSYTSSTLSDGNHTVEVWVKDESGKESYISWSFYVDTTKPTISLFVPPEDAVVTEVYSVSAKVEDEGAGVDKHNLFMELNSIDVTASLQYDEATKTLSFSPLVKLTPGTYDVEIWAKDKVGNENHAEWSFTVASTAPIIGTLRPQNNSNITDGRPEISAVITDAGRSGINTNSIKVFLDGTEVTGRAVYNAGSGKVSYTPSQNLSDGTHTVEVRVRDNNNQQSIAVWSFTVDASPPLPPTNFTANQNESGTVLSWTPSSSNDTAAYIIYGFAFSFTGANISGMTSLVTLSAENSSFFHNITSRYYYAIVAQDRMGNKAQPVFAGTCSIYNPTTGWTDYECCKDSDCTDGYYCDEGQHVCKINVSTEGRERAEAAIRDSRFIINAAREAGKNVSEAESFLENAQNAFNTGNYAQAEHFATLAADAARAARPLEGSTEENGEKKKPLPCCPSAFILAVLGFIATLNLHKS